MATQSNLETFEAAVAGASNDECVEMTYRIHEHLSRRVDNVSRLSKAVGDRAGVNEAFALAAVVNEIIPHLFEHADKRAHAAWWRTHEAKQRLEKAIKRRGKTIQEIPFAELDADERRDLWKAEEEELARKQAEGDKLLAKADLSQAAVLEALRSAVAESPDGLTRARDVALRLVPKAADTKTPGRQRLIARVGMVLRELTAAGELQQFKKEPKSRYSGMVSSRYALPGGHDAS